MSIWPDISDNALPEDSEDDDYDRKRFAGQLFSLIVGLADRPDSIVIGLSGAWGSGKSSVLTRLSRKFLGEKRWSVAEFNPWLFGDSTSLTMGFLNTLGQVLPDSGYDSTKQKLSRLAARIAPYAGALNVPWVDAEKVVAGIGRVAGGGEVSAARLMDNLRNTLANSESRTLVIIDDLDRLSASELLMTFKLVRLVGGLPNVHYVLAYDEATVLDLITKTDLIGEDDPARARDYLEKVVQVRVALPPIRRAQFDRVFGSFWSTFVSATGMEVRPADDERLGVVYPFLAARLVTPRALKRLAMALHAGWSVELHDEVNLVDYLMIVYVRAFESGVYAGLVAEREYLTGSDSMRFSTYADWLNWLRERGVSGDRVLQVDSLLAVLFPGRITPSGKASGIPLVPFGASRPEYFDRYFAYSVPDEDLSELEFNQAIGAISGKSFNGARERLTREIVSSPMRVGRRVMEVFAGDSQLAVAVAMYLLLEVLGQIPEKDQSVADLAFRQHRQVMSAAICELNLTELTEVIGVAEERGDIALAFLAESLHLNVADLAGSKYLLSEELRLSVRSATSELCSRAAATFASKSLDDVTRAQIRILRVWLWLDGGAARSWVQAKLQAGWDLFEYLQYVYLDTPDPTGATWESRSMEFARIEWIDDYVGRDFVEVHAASEVATASPILLGGPVDGSEVSFRDFVLGIVRSAQASAAPE
jgi:hypothetical protein